MSSTPSQLMTSCCPSSLRKFKKHFAYFRLVMPVRELESPRFWAPFSRLGPRGGFSELPEQPGGDLLAEGPAVGAVRLLLVLVRRGAHHLHQLVVPISQHSIASHRIAKHSIVYVIVFIAQYSIVQYSASLRATASGPGRRSPRCSDRRCTRSLRSPPGWASISYHMYIYIYIYNTHISLSIYIYIYIYDMCIHIYIYIYTYIHIMLYCMYYSTSIASN